MKYTSWQITSPLLKIALGSYHNIVLNHTQRIQFINATDDNYNQNLRSEVTVKGAMKNEKN